MVDAGTDPRSVQPVASDTDEIVKGGLGGLDFSTEDIAPALQNARDGAVNRGLLGDIAGAGVGLGDRTKGRFPGDAPSQIASQMTAIIVKRPTKPIGEADAGAPTSDCTKSTVVGYKVADINALALGWKLSDLVFPISISRNDRLGQIRQVAGFVAANIERQSLRFLSNRGKEERFGRVVDVKQIPTLLTAPDLEGLPLNNPAQPDAQKGLSSILDTHSRPINVGQTQRATLDSIDVAKKQMVCFPRHLINTVHIDRSQWMALVDREIVRSAINLARPGMDDRDTRIDRAACFQQLELGRAVYREIVSGCSH